MKKLILLLVFIPSLLKASVITGVIKNTKGSVLPFASVLIKGTTKGTTANSKGQYSLSIEEGNCILLCQHVGYKTVEKSIKVHGEAIVNFELEEQQYNLHDVVVKSGGEDPAYAIIRKAIQKRSVYENEFKRFQCEVYIKGQMQLRDYPKKFMGEKIDFEDGDTSKRKMLFLSESVARYSVEDGKKKIEVLSTKVSGDKGGFGFASPQIISFYNNIISVGSGLNPRGFISPIASNALNFYKYKFEGSFFENGKEINRIKVIPRRKYEPLFSGYINIIEDEWRLQSVQLTILKEQQMQLLDTLNIEQIYVPLKNTWVIKQQLIYPAGKLFSFDFFGTFIQVYDKFDVEPSFKKNFFNNTIIKYFDSSNKKTFAYWDSIRTIPLLTEEIKDYKKKDSLEQVKKDPKYLDSLDRVRNKVTFNKLFSFGSNFGHEKNKTIFYLPPIVSALESYNTVEGYLLNYSATFSKAYKNSRKRFSITPAIRYGFSNKHFNAYLNGQYSYGKKYLNSIMFSGGKRVYQFNNAGPIDPANNSLSTLFWQHNYMKIYEAKFASLGYSKDLGDGFNIGVLAQYQRRMPLNNTVDSLRGKVLTPNYPYEITSANMTEHNAFITTLSLIWRPGAKYMELPDRKINLGSKYPTFRLSITKGIDKILGSDVDYAKWKFTVSDNLNMKLGGRFSYRLEAGGFFNANKTFIPDYNHFLGNQTAIASQYLNSFQLMPYYQYSNTEKTYGAAHAEYHLNGLLSNKIPGFRKLNCFFVVGGNALYMNSSNYYYEAFFSIENIFKVARIDFVAGFQPDKTNSTGIRFSMPLMKNGGQGN